MILALSLMSLGLVSQDVPPMTDAEVAAAVRAERCHAHVMLLIEEVAATGPVAGPSWFIRDWWQARLPETSTDEGRAATRAGLLMEKAQDAEVFVEERRACINEAIDAGSVPGMGPTGPVSE